MSLSPFGEFVVETLCWRLRVVAATQLARTPLAPACPDRLARELRKLCSGGWLQSLELTVPVLDLTSPAFSWRAGRRVGPEVWRLCWLAESRMKRAALDRQQVYLATQKAERFFGGVGGRLRQPFQIAHDLGTASVYVAHLHRKKLDADPDWVSEDVIRRYYRRLKVKKIPDAALIVSGRLSRALEFVGKDYSGQQLNKFHTYWSARKTAYEIW